jgi:hypothetical protein
MYNDMKQQQNEIEILNKKANIQLHLLIYFDMIYEFNNIMKILYS